MKSLELLTKNEKLEMFQDLRFYLKKEKTTKSTCSNESKFKDFMINLVKTFKWH